MLKINQAAFNDIVKRLVLLPKYQKIAVAVSGGADSVCLTLLLKNFAESYSLNLTAIIVDHNLRKESTKEALFVQDLLKLKGINTIILTRQNIPLYSKIQETARSDRYQLLINYCKQEDISHLFFAHHQDDQLETLIMRSSKGNNIIGCSGMSARVNQASIILVRPLLEFTKNDILEFMKYHSFQWVDDPSNTNYKYERVRIRDSLKNTNNENLILTLKNNIIKRKNLEQEYLKFILKNLEINQFGIAKIDLNDIFSFSEEALILGFRNLLGFVSQKNFFIKIAKIKHLLNIIKSNSFKCTSLNYCIVERKKNYILIYKEPSKVDNIVVNNIWDGRISLDGIDLDKFEIRFLEEQDYSNIDKNSKRYLNEYNVFFRNKNVIPWFFYKNKLIISITMEKIFFTNNSNFLYNNFVSVSDNINMY